MDDQSLSISIPISSIYEEFLCPLCFEEITDCHMTSCGHNFCEQCIRECLNRQHKCPLCQRATTQDNLAKNYMFDNLLQKVNSAKERVSKEYVANVARKAEINIDLDGSPIERIFQKHLKGSLMSYEQYYQDVKEKFERRKSEINSAFTFKMEEIRARLKVEARVSNLPEPNVDMASPMDESSQLEDLSAQCASEISNVQKQFEHCVGLLCQSYDSYMSNMAPSAFVLPVGVKLRLRERNRYFEVKLKSTDTMRDVRAVLSNQMASIGDPFVRFDDRSWFEVRSSVYGEKNEGGRDNLQRVPDENLTVHELHIEQGSDIILMGEFLTKSDAPVVCFTALFKKGEEQRMDYYKCNTCNFNWICKSCASACHKDHLIVPFMMNHKPSYGCCYCVKKKRCIIENSRSLKQK